MTDRAALAKKLRWAYPRGPSYVTQEEWRIVFAALEAAPDRQTLARALRETWWMLTSVSGEGTDTQALDHVVRRMQDKYGNVEGWCNAAMQRACFAPRSDADAPRASAPAPSGDDVPGEWPDSENHGEPAAPAPSEALLPCPFCGAPPVVVMPEENYGGPECHTPNCPASPLTTGDWPDMRAAHFAVWNRRVAPREPTEEAVVGLELDGAGGPQACVTVSENRGLYFLHAVYPTRAEADAALARLSADAPSDEAVAREMSGYAPGTVGFSSCLDDVRNVRDAERAARDRAKGSG